MEPFALFILVFSVAAAASGALASEPKEPEPTEEEKLAKALAKLLTRNTPASDP